MRLAKPLIHLLLVAAMFLSGARPLFAQETPGQPSTPSSGAEAAQAQLQAQLDEALAVLDGLDALMLDLQDQIDRTHFDLDELEFAIGFDAEDILAFVRDEIAFEQYPGALRGPYGTLMSRAGNALDQAALLWTMLSDAGYDARIARGTLSRTQAAALLLTMGAPRSPSPSPLLDEAAAKETLVAMAELGGAAPDEAAAAIETLWEIAPVEQTIHYSRTISTTQFLIDTLADAGIELGSATAENALRAEAQDYYWVEYRLGPRDEWAQAHPAFPADAAPENLVAEELFETGLPEEAHYTLRVEMAIEQQTGDILQTIPIMQPWERSVLDLIAQPHTIGLFADGFADTADYADPAAAYARTDYYFPLLDGKLPPGAMFFDLEGNVLPPDVATSPFAPLAGSIGGVLEGATGILGGLGSDEPAESASEIGPSAILNGAWIDYTLIRPDGSEKTQRRILWERAEPEDLSDTSIVVDPLEAGPALTAQHTWMAAVGSIPPGYRLDRLIGEWLQMRPMIEVALVAEIDPQAAARSLDDLPPPKIAWSGHLMTFAFFDELPVEPGSVRYRAEPLLVQRKQVAGATTATGVTMSMDVIFNAQRAYQLSRGRVRLDAAAALRAGVWESETEGLILSADATNVDTANVDTANVDTANVGATNAEAANVQNTQAVFAAAVEQELPLRVFAPGESGEVFDLFVGSSQTLRAIQRDLDAGYAVVVPQFVPEGFDYVGWWRIDPQTGETLGMIDSGTGGAMVEYLLIVSQSVAGLVCYGVSAADSSGLTGKDVLTCWLAAAAGTVAVTGGLMAGAAFGVVVAAAIAGAINTLRAGVGNNSSL